MSNFERWFLLVYTAYTAISILALMWVGRDAQRQRPQRLRRPRHR